MSGVVAAVVDIQQAVFGKESNAIAQTLCKQLARRGTLATVLLFLGCDPLLQVETYLSIEGCVEAEMHFLLLSYGHISRQRVGKHILQHIH